MRYLNLLLLLALVSGCGNQINVAVQNNGQNDISDSKAPQKIFKGNYVLIVAGQSNAVGRAPNPLAKPEITKYTFTRTKIFVNGSWAILDPSDSTQSNGQYANNHGIEPYLAYRFETENPDANLFIIKYAVGGTSLAADYRYPDWSPSTSEIYPTFTKTYLRSAFDSKELTEASYTPLGFWWMQGETDSLYSSYATLYSGNLSYFFSTLGTDIPETTFFKRYIGQVLDDPTWTYRSYVRQAQTDFCKVTGNNATLIDTDSISVLSSDPIHYSALGFSQLSDALLAEF